MGGIEGGGFVFKFIPEMAKKPALFFLLKKLERLKSLSGFSRYHPSGSGRHQAFRSMRSHLILVIIEQTKSAEGLNPVQHFLLYLSEITYRICMAVKVITVQWSDA